MLLMKKILFPRTKLYLMDELVFLQPVEYNSYFAGACISWRWDANGGAWQPHYRITDHLGSTRLETSSNGTITAAYDYKPFGEQIPLMTTTTRKTYIGKERDEESYLGDFGVRKYDYAAGRFTSPDVLWENDRSFNPYHYSHNNPISRKDGNGYVDGNEYMYGFNPVWQNMTSKEQNDYAVSAMYKSIYGIGIIANAAGIILSGGTLAAAELSVGGAVFGSVGLMGSIYGTITNSIKLGDNLAGTKNKAIAELQTDPGSQAGYVADKLFKTDNNIFRNIGGIAYNSLSITVGLKSVNIADKITPIISGTPSIIENTFSIFQGTSKKETKYQPLILKPEYYD